MSPRPPAISKAQQELGIDTVDSTSYALRRVDPTAGRPRWPLPLLASGSTTLVATGAAPWLVGGGTAPMVGAGVLGTLTSTAVVVHAVRAQRREEITDAAKAAVQRVAGPVRDFRAQRWSGWFVGFPMSVQFRYHPGAVISDKLWPGDALAALAAVLGGGYRIRRHDVRRGILKLRAKPQVVRADTDPTVDRAVSMMHQLFGQSATVKASTADSGLQMVSISHECGVKATFPVWRERVERVVTTMLDGRWRARWDLQHDAVTFEVRPEIETFVQRPAPAKDPASPDYYKIPLGLDEDNQIVSWDLNSSMPHFLVSGKTGKGKACYVSTPIPTPLGWSRLGDLEVGDQVFDDTGNLTIVTGVYDQSAGRECFEVTFSDEETIVADAEHLWWTEDRAARTARWVRQRDRIRSQRLSPDVVQRLHAAVAECADTDTLTIPEAAELLKLSPESRWLHAVAAEVGGATERIRIVNNPYREQVVTQRQTVRIYEATSTTAHLNRVATTTPQLQPWSAQLLTLTIERDMTVHELAKRTGVSREVLRNVLNNAGTIDSRLEQRLVDLQVPARTVRRNFGTVRAFPKKPFLTALADDGARLLNHQRHLHATGRVRSTREIRDTLTTVTGHLNHSIPLAKPLDLPSADLPIGPYTLGAWLGDGDSWGARITSSDPEILDYIEAEGYGIRLYADERADVCPRYGIVRLRSELRSSGLLKTKREQQDTKRIPKIYLRASVAQRRDLLAGLLDTDGTVSPQGTTQFTTTRIGLADDVYELAVSLGYRVSRIEGVARLNGRACGPKWTLSFTTTDPVFKLKRKLAALQVGTVRHNPDKNNCRYIREVRPVPEVPMRCITVDSPNHLFLAGRGMIPTHNTVVLRGIAMEVAARQIPVWLCDPKRVELIGLRDWPNVQIVATTVEEQIATILRAWDLMEERYAAIADGASEEDFELIVLVVDEFAEFSRRVAQWWTRVKVRGMPTVCPVMEKFDSLVRLGRTARFRIAIGLQRPDVRFFGESGESRDNFDSRVSLGRLSADGSRMMWGSSIGTSLPGVRGRAIACTSEDRACEIQTYWVPDPRRSQDDPAERTVLDRLRTGHASHERLTVVIPEPTVDSKGVVQVWDAVASAVLEPYEAPPGPNDVSTGDAINDEADDSDDRYFVDTDFDDARRESAGTADDDGTSATIVKFRPRDSARPAKPAAAPDRADPRPETGDTNPLTDYGPPTIVAAAELEDGELVELDERWVVVESIEPDLFNDSDYALAWRSTEVDSDDEGTVILPGGARLRSRSLTDVEDGSE